MNTLPKFEKMFPLLNLVNTPTKIILLKRKTKYTLASDSEKDRIRFIDYYIHFCDTDYHNIYNIKDFLYRQDAIISLTEYCQVDIFNDLYVYNNDPLTDVLRACYFKLYSNLIQNKEIIYNIENIDIFIGFIFSIKYNHEENKIFIPQSEFQAIKQISLTFRDTEYYQNKYTERWWDNLEKFWDTHILKWEYWRTPENRTSSGLWGRIKTHFQIDDRTTWQTHPCYIYKPKDNFYIIDDEHYTKRIKFLRALFNDDSMNECIDITEYSLTELKELDNYEVNTSISYNMKYMKYMKYKKKYLNLTK